MPNTDYHFIDRWRVEGDVKEVADILAMHLACHAGGPRFILK